MTNADKIRGMSDDDLKEAMWKEYVTGFEDAALVLLGKNPHLNGLGYYENWLKQPAETEGTE